MDQHSDDSPISASRHDAPEHDTSRHTLTIKQAAHLFADLGVPRSPRSVQRFCELNNIDCIRVKGEKTERYFVNQPSVERYAEELKQLENISRIEDDTARYDAPQRDMTRNDAPRREAPASVEPVISPDREAPAPHERIVILEKEKLQLAIDRAAKEQVIGQMLDERRTWLGQLTEQSRVIGRLEMQVQQLEAPKSDTSRHDATTVEEPAVVPTPVPPEAAPVVVIQPEPPASAATETPKPSVWKKLFG